MISLHVQDTDDLNVVSSHMQDALIRRADMRFLKTTRQFAFISNRFAWERLPEKIRHRSGLHINHVLAVRQTGFSRMSKDTILSLMAISFTLKDAPSGVVTLAFSAGPILELDVEYLDLSLRDLGPEWAASQQPKHD